MRPSESRWNRERRKAREADAEKWRLAQAQTLADYTEGRLDDLPLDEGGKIVPSPEALRKIDAER